MRAFLLTILVIAYGCAGVSAFLLLPEDVMAGEVYLQDGRWQKNNTDLQKHCWNYTMKFVSGASGVTVWVVNDVYNDCLISNGAMI